ncbi:MAG TPA: HEAT repeat domain-containing protein [Kofleriaceae bacterium]|nr:HEAT repeat domain-containing protein [Kofleriaceae bacterium]
MKLSRWLLGIALLARPAVAGFNWIGQVELDADGLKSDDAKKQADAIQALQADDIHLAEPYLMKALANGANETIKQAAAKALGSGGAMAAVPYMVEWLSSSDVKRAAVAADVLGDLGGPQATQALVRSLGDPDDIVRQRAVKALGKIGLHGNPSVVVALIPRLDDAKTDVRKETVEQLEQLGDRRAVIPLVARFGEPNKEVSKAAIRAVGRLGDRAAVPALVRMMTDPQEDVRTAAVGSLGQLGAVDAIDALVEQLSTGSDAYREKVAYALGQIAASQGAGKAGEDAMRTLVENLALPGTRHAAQNALRVAGRAAVPALVANLSGQLKGDPTTAVTLLGESADARATAALAAELERGRVAIPLVLKALGATGDPDALVPVLGQLAAKDAAIRLAAMAALRPLLGRDARAGDVLVEHLADEDLEVRVLAAEYLGLLELPTAAPKLIALAGPGNPTRLRRAAIDALGRIHASDAAKPLIDVLREGQPELERPAATALSYIADPSAIPALIAQVRAERGPTRHEVVRALAATLRDHPDPEARKLMRELVDDGDVRVALAAIAALAAAGDANDAPVLRALVERGASDRRRAAAWALGELHDQSGYGSLLDALSVHDDRLVGDAVWALGELASAAAANVQSGPIVDRWLYLAHHGGWAGAIDSTAALGRALWALPRDARAGLLAGARKAALVQLASHKSRLVRVNAAFALGSLGGDADAQKALAQLAHDESSRVRAAAAAATAAAKAPAAPVPARDHWVVFQVVDKGSDDAPVRQEPYFVIFPDGLVWATYSDAKGELASEHVPPGDSETWTVMPASREGEL